jgi:hypothetical protein
MPAGGRRALHAPRVLNRGAADLVDKSLKGGDFAGVRRGRPGSGVAHLSRPSHTRPPPHHNAWGGGGRVCRRAGLVRAVVGAIARVPSLVDEVLDSVH